jgi:GNAT superfamily N-acetyltransferase
MGAFYPTPPQAMPDRRAPGHGNRCTANEIRFRAVNIRSAQMSDFAAVTDLLEQLGRSRVTNENYAACRDVYAAQLEDPHADHLVVEDERGTVVGFCSLHYRPRLNRSDLQAWIPDLVVTRAARGRGTARALLDHAERLARARGCWELTLESGYARSEAHLLYTAAGMDDAGKMFRKAL